MEIGRRGQSTIEYLLLISVVITVVTAILRSDLVRDRLGREGTFFQEYARSLSYNYRHGVPYQGGPGIAERPQDDYQTEHDTYKRADGGAKFVIPLGVYPENI